ncbi:MULTISPECIES: hypothetical protein [Photorhabdus]|uniref:hypothetical protein n=1 Tax=Photorhabdus TaxID=29487 RepID=UPI000A6336E2|nr:MULTISPECIES: hypothetical protein [Photorhabdus]NDK96360.1 hypothetical protein [Photorhabdus laumondii subsp. laumondii]NDL48182.1 hypothetical protein [Photorhabdus laumondii subsp. laumondii]
MTGVSECSQQRSNLKDDGYIPYGTGITFPFLRFIERLNNAIIHNDVKKARRRKI